MRVSRSLVLIVLCWFSDIAYANYNVLLIHSYDPQHKWTQFITEGFEAAITQPDKTDNQEIIVFNEYMDAKRFPRSEYQDQFYQYLREKYENHRIDFVVTSDDPALNLLLRHSHDAFHQVPIIFMGVNLVTEDLLLRRGITGVFENRDLESTMVAIKETFGSNELIVITDESSTGMANLVKINRALGNPLVPANTQVITKMKVSELDSTLTVASSNTPILLIGQLFDDTQNNELMGWTEGVKLLSNTVDNPIVSIAIITLELGATAAHELNGQQHAAAAAGLLLRLINGENVDDVDEITQQTSTWYFNWQKMKQYQLSENDIPPNAIVMFEDISFFKQNRALIISFSIALFIAGIIIALLTEIVRRSKHEKRILADNETRYRDLALEGANIFWESDPSENVTYISGDIASILHVNIDLQKGTSIRELLCKTPLIEFQWSEYDKCLRNQTPIKSLIAKYKKADQSMAVVSISAKARFDQSNCFIGYRGIIKEVTGEYQLTEQIAFEASHDALTGLYNRRIFSEHFIEIVTANNSRSENVYLCYLDLDNFKAVNDSIGHLAGDGMLADIAVILSSNISRKDILARLGGDEFGLILRTATLDEALGECEQLIAKVQGYKLRWDNRHYSVGLSIGMVSVDDNLSYEELLSHADIACYKAKEQSRGMVYYSSSGNTDISEEQVRLGYIANINQALENNQFFFAKQRIFPLSSAELTPHYELLLRFTDQDGKAIPPGLFIPMAEKYGVITLIDKWVIKHAITHYHELFDNTSPHISINVSGISLSTQGFLAEVKALVETATFDVSHLCFEITETAVISHISKAIDFISALKPLGCKFALDDFGSGASSYGYLKQLPVDYLKIDGSLIQSIEHEFIDQAIVKSINEIAHELNIKTIAEYIENEQIMQIVKDIGVDYGQGFHIHKPEFCLEKDSV